MKFTLPESDKSYAIGKVWVSIEDPENLTYVKTIDSRDYSTTYLLNYHEEQLVMKWIYKSGVKPIDLEVEIHMRCAAVGIAPKVRWAFAFKEGAIIVMEFMDEELGVYLTNESRLESDFSLDLISMIALIEKLHDLDIYHGDIGVTNIMIKYDQARENLPVFYLIDFGESIWISDQIEADKSHLKKEDLRTFSDAIMDLSADFNFENIRRIHFLLQAYSDRRYPTN
ncbi:MAG: lipopolysaccharide kinase InaA family protein [Candidatus Roizmanbacteria bacterium]